MHKRITRFSRIVIINRSAARVPAVNTVLRRLERLRRRRNAPVAVIHAGEGTLLIYHTRDAVGEGGMLNSVENNGTYGNLPLIAFAPRLGLIIKFVLH